ncbi:MAG TPA: FxsA family protein [Pirellulaceae bacterium]|nr:FxsA family protein [Pirellulaceae bacterium]
MRRIFLTILTLFIVVPILELTLLLLVGSYTAWWVPLAMVLVTGVVGSLLAHSQGWKTVKKIRSQLGSGRIPADSLMDGAMILAAGIMLLTPGLISDTVGISLLLPPIRRFYKDWLIRWFAGRFHVRTMLSHFGSGRIHDDDDDLPARSPRRSGEVVDSYVVKEDRHP